MTLPPEFDSLAPRERQELLCAYLDGELPAERARDITAWLERHPDALREVERQRRLWDLLGRYADEPVPAGFAKSVVNTVGAGKATGRAAGGAGARRLALPRRAWALAAAAAVLAAVGVALYSSRGTSDTPVAPEGTEMATLESIDVDFVQHADLGSLLSLSDAQFQALLYEDPDALADGTAGG